METIKTARFKDVRCAGGNRDLSHLIVNSKINVELIKYRYSEEGTTLGRSLMVKTQYYFWNIN